MLAQTHKTLEIIVVDDGSNDETEAAVSGLDNRVHYVRQRNAGVSAARNLGMSIAQGKYVALLDSDDTWLPWKLEAQLAVLRAFPEAGMVWSDMAAVDEAGRTICDSYLRRMYSAYVHFDPERDFTAHRMLGDLWDSCPPRLRDRQCSVGDISPWMFMGNLVHTSTVLLRRERLVRVGEFDLSLRFSGEDYDFHYRTCRQGPVAYVDIPSVCYRVGAADQLTSPELMIWIARNNLTTVVRAFAAANGRISLPLSLIDERLGFSFIWLGRAELPIAKSQARRDLRYGLSLLPRTCRSLRRKTILYLGFSVLPSSLFRRLEAMRHGPKTRRPAQE